MYMDYKSYKTYCFGSPEFGAVVFSIGIFILGVQLVYMMLSKQWDWRKYAFPLLWIVGAGIVVCIKIGILYNGGIYLRDEKETDAVEMQGEITHIRGLGEFSFPRIHGDYGYEEKNGYEFTINGVQCAFVAKGSLEVGDYVTVKYLPKSGYILYIAKVNEESSDTE